MLQNNLGKPITGFCIRTDHSGMTLKQILPPHPAVMPGAIYRERIPLAGLPPDEANREVLSLSISCVASSTGVSGERPDDVRSMSEMRAGQAFQASRLQDFLNHIRDSSNDGFQVTVQETISKIVAMDITLNDGTKAQGLFAAGMQSTNTILVSRLRELVAVSAAGRSITEIRGKFDQIQQDHRDLLEALGGRGGKL
jgi:hypothetical protein